MDRIFSDQEFQKRKKRLEERITDLMSLYPETNLTPKQQKRAYEQGKEEFPVGSLVHVHSSYFFYGGVVQEIDARGVIYVATVFFPPVSQSTRTEEYPAYKDHCFEPSTYTETITTYTYSLKKFIPLHSKKAAEYGHPRTDEVNYGGERFAPARHPFKDLRDGVPYLPTFKDGRRAGWSSFKHGHWFDNNLVKREVNTKGLF